jgi:TIR domain
MSLRVFLSFSVDPEDQVLIWRLQTLATAQGIDMYIPLWQVIENRRPGPLPQFVREAIDKADCVLAIVTTRTGTKVRDELTYALQKGRLIVPLVEQSVVLPQFFKKLPQVFYFTQNEPPGRLEAEVVEFLKQQQFKKEAGQQLGAVIAIGLGLLALSALTQD